MIPNDFLYFSLNLTLDAQLKLNEYLMKNEEIKNILMFNKNEKLNKYLHHCTLFHKYNKTPISEELRNYLYNKINEEWEKGLKENYKIKVIGYGYTEDKKAVAFKIDEESIKFPKVLNHIYHITIFTFGDTKPYESNKIKNWIEIENPIEIECFLMKNTK